MTGQVNMLMEEAPKDRRILILMEIWHHVGYRRAPPETAPWGKVGEKWVECFWYVPDYEDGQGPRWMKWGGSERSINSETVTAIAWAETPGEKLW